MQLKQNLEGNLQLQMFILEKEECNELKELENGKEDKHNGREEIMKIRVEINKRGNKKHQRASRKPKVKALERLKKLLNSVNIDKKEKRNAQLSNIIYGND